MAPDKKYTLRRAERLTSKKEIALLFNAGQHFFMAPFYILYLSNHRTAGSHLQAAFTVSKRKFPLAAHRNRIRRRMREAYRQNNTELKLLLQDKHTYLSVVFSFTGTSHITFDEMEEKIKPVLKRLYAIINGDQ